jgi:hypothetical protein
MFFLLSPNSQISSKSTHQKHYYNTIYNISHVLLLRSKNYTLFRPIWHCSRDCIPFTLVHIHSDFKSSGFCGIVHRYLCLFRFQVSLLFSQTTGPMVTKLTEMLPRVILIINLFVNSW